ncbi:hypothetical protein O3P69_019650 [Scylla paramamosain]|uniref:deoxyhypusine synthase n=1 Tax=Scylla paramamosain TaxID=85552 RepID=A0AAW0SWS7_SCYPA
MATGRESRTRHPEYTVPNPPFPRTLPTLYVSSCALPPVVPLVSLGPLSSGVPDVSPVSHVSGPLSVPVPSVSLSALGPMSLVPLSVSENKRKTRGNKRKKRKRSTSRKHVRGRERGEEVKKRRKRKNTKRRKSSTIIIISNMADQEQQQQQHDASEEIEPQLLKATTSTQELTITNYSNHSYIPDSRRQSFGRAVEEINKMIACREEPMKQTDNLQVSDKISVKNNCTVFLGYTSNMASCGVRETIRFLVEHRLVDCLVTTAGGVEEDLIKCLAPTYLGDFHLKGRDLRMKGINRIGNLLVPNNNYCKFEDWVMPILDELLREQKEEGGYWTPSKIIARLGKEINNKTSIAYWAAVRGVPIFSPALTDGSLGDMIYFHGIRNPGLVVDIAEDLRLINQLAKRSLNTGMVIVGGGVVKHHICNSNLMRNGANYSVYLNTASEWDGSDSGARPDEAVSWGKIRLDANPVKIYV